MARPPLYGNGEDSEQPLLKTRLRERTAAAKESGQQLSQQVSEAMSAKPAGDATEGQAPRAQPVDEGPRPPLVKRAMPVQGQKAVAAPEKTTAPQTTAAPQTSAAQPVTTKPATIDISKAQPLRGLAYGPNSEGATAADQRQTHGPLGQLQEGDIAVSPNLLNQYPLRSYVNVVDKDGNVVLANQRVADTSWYSEGKPTVDTFEVWNGRSLGKGYYLVPTEAPTASFAQGGIVTKPTVALVGERGPEAIVPLTSDLGGNFSAIAGLMSG